MAKDRAAVSLGRRGGNARMTTMTPEQRKAVAKKAAETRWAKTKRAIKEDVKRAKQLTKELAQ